MFRNCLVTVTLAALISAGCGGSSHGVAGAVKTVRRCDPGVKPLTGSRRVAWAAVALRPTTVFARPGGAAIRRFGLHNVNGVDTVFGVLGERVDARCRVAWLHVGLPIRPNGADGWVRVRSVARVAVHARIAVDLSE